MEGQEVCYQIMFGEACVLLLLVAAIIVFKAYSRPKHISGPMGPPGPPGPTGEKGDSCRCACEQERQKSQSNKLPPELLDLMVINAMDAYRAPGGPGYVPPKKDDP